PRLDSPPLILTPVPKPCTDAGVRESGGPGAQPTSKRLPVRPAGQASNLPNGEARLGCYLTRGQPFSRRLYWLGPFSHGFGEAGREGQRQRRSLAQKRGDSFGRDCVKKSRVGSQGRQGRRLNHSAPPQTLRGVLRP